MKALSTKCAATLLLTLCLPGIASAWKSNKCDDDILSGQYVSRPADSRGPLPVDLALPGFPRRSLKSSTSTATVR